MIPRSGFPHSARALICAALAAILVLPFVGATASAQISEDEIQIVELDATNYPEIELTVDVPPTLASSNLNDRHFAVQEGGVGRDVSAEKLSETIAVVLAVDTSGSMNGEPIAVAKQSALAFLDGLPARHPVAVLGFGDDVLVATELTTDRDAAASAIANLASGGETSLFDALASGAGLLGTADTDRVAMVLLSDGADTASSATAEQAVASLTSAQVPLYSIGLETGDSKLTELNELTVSSGGRFLSASDLDQLGAVYDDLAARLSNQYRLTFGATSDGPVEVRVTVAGDNGALASVTTVAELSADAAGPVGSGNSSDTNIGPIDELAGPVLSNETIEITPGFMETGTTRWLGLGALFFTFSVMAYSIMSMTKSGPRRGLEPRRQSTNRKLPGVADWASGLVDRFLLDGTRRGAMNAALDRAGMNVRPGEFIVLTAMLSAVTLVVGWLLHPLIGIGLAGGVAVGARFFVAFRGSIRRNKFAGQLDNTLVILASSLRAGHGVQRALSVVAEESDSPTNEEFTRVVAETRIGRDLVEALQGVADRLGNDDFDWVVRAVAINRELGGNLSEVLDNVAFTIRERNQLRRQVKALSAEGRLSAMILYVLPFGVALFVQATNPGYMAELTGSTGGTVMIIMAAVAMLGGGAWIKKIVNVRF